MKSLAHVFSLILSAVVFSACVPKIYVIDRQTVLESEAAGEWPMFEKDVLGLSKAPGPTALSHTPASAGRQRLYNVLNGELASHAQ